VSLPAEPVTSLTDTAQAIETQLASALVGQRETVRGVVIALLAGGHVLLEGLPGLGKTLLVRALSEAVSLRFSRIQFTPDLMPADVFGTTILADQGSGAQLGFRPGPIFANLVLADEINRASPKTQAALLEAMQEETVTLGGQTYDLPRPFFVLATQNPIELEGTYPLPEAELDRFLFKLRVDMPSRQELNEILSRTTGGAGQAVRAVVDGPMLLRLQRVVRDVPIAGYLVDYVSRLVLATHPEESSAPPTIRRFVRYGASPRAGQALVLGSKVRALLEGRFNVSYEDVRALAPLAFRHRLALSFEAEASGVGIEQLLAELLDRVPREA
jgi:MoxR-like ATPase